MYQVYTYDISVPSSVLLVVSVAVYLSSSRRRCVTAVLDLPSIVIIASVTVVVWVGLFCF